LARVRNVPDEQHCARPLVAQREEEGTIHVELDRRWGNRDHPEFYTDRRDRRSDRTLFVHVEEDVLIGLVDPVSAAVVRNDTARERRAGRRPPKGRKERSTRIDA